MSDCNEQTTEEQQLQNSVERVSVERNEHDQKLSCKVQYILCAFVDTVRGPSECPPVLSMPGVLSIS